MPVVVQSELVANEPLPPTVEPIRAPRPRSASPLGSRVLRRPAALRRSSSTRPAASGLTVGGRDGSRDRRPGGHRDVDRELSRTSRRLDGHRRRAARASRCGSSSSSPTAGRASARSPALRDQVAAALADARHTGWDGLLRRAARVPRRLLGARRRRARGRRRASAGGPLRALPRAAGGRPRRAARDRRQGADRARLRRPHVLGHRDVRAPGAHLHARRGRAARCAAVAARDARAGARARAARSDSQGAAFPWRTIHGEECSGYWPAGTAAFHVNADIADAVDALPGRDRRRGVRARGRGRAARRDGAAVALARPPRRRRALPDRRRHRPRRVQRDRRQQRLHEPDGAAEPARRRRRGRAPPGAARPSSASTTRRRRAGAMPPRRC